MGKLRKLTALNDPSVTEGFTVKTNLEKYEKKVVDKYYRRKEKERKAGIGME